MGPTPPPQATRVDLDGQVRGYAQAVLAEWLSTDIWQPAQQLRAVTRRAAEEYAGRFLLELLQNAHDAHPPAGRDGRCSLVLDEDEGDNGVLYVANGGAGFVWDRVKAICKLALSPKVVGEGIGNKGVGFRSVLQISSAPEIYSSLTTGFDGYRFRFATPNDLAVLLGDEKLAARAVAELPPLQVPIPLVEEVPSTVGALGSAGYVTVVRLPLRSAEALAQVRLRLDELVGSDTPVMLFLERLSHLLVERRSGPAVLSNVSLTRDEVPLAHGLAHPGAGLDEVQLVTADLGEEGSFVIARGTVCKERLRATLVTAVADTTLDESYLAWDEPAVVSLALLADGSHVASGRLYTFLPLGPDAASPAPAHLNGPFFTKIDRSALDPDHPLNVMLTDAAAETAVAAAVALHRTVHAGARQWATQLVAWDRPHAHRLSDATSAILGVPFPRAALVPVLAVGSCLEGWAPADQTLRWPGKDLVVLTPRAVAERTASAVIDESLGDKLLNRLASLLAELDCGLDRPLTDLADIAEVLVAELPLPPRGRAIAQWNALYDDLARLFETDPAVLRGRRLLLAADGTLRHTNGDRAGVPAAARENSGGSRRRRPDRQIAFFPPARGDGSEQEDEEEFAPPAWLAKRLFYMHPDLIWLQPASPRRYTPTRIFLERSLVRPFDATSLIEHVRGALATSNNQRLRDQSLRFVFNLQRSRPYSGPPALKDVGLQLRTATGWTSASSAVFGKGWPGTAGDDLAVVVADGASSDTDLAFMAARMIAPPDSLVRKGETVEEWMQFLKTIGVRDGLLTLVTANASGPIVGRYLTDDEIVRTAKVSSTVAEQWRQHLHRGKRPVLSPDTPYVGTPMHRLAGQGVIAQLTSSARLAYCRLVMRGLAKWPPEMLTSTWTRDRRTGPRDEQLVPTPLAAFLSTEPWIPVRSHDKHLAFVPPTQAWLPPPAGEEEPPYVPLVVSVVRPLLEPVELSPRLRGLGLAAWGAPHQASRALQVLASAAADGRIRPEDVPGLRRENERAWRNVVARDRHLLNSETASSALVPMTHVLVDVGDAVTPIAFSTLQSGESPLYVAANRHQVTAGLVRELGLPLLVLPSDAFAAAELLKLRCGAAVRHVDDADLAVEVDGAPLSLDSEKGGALSTLAQQVPWLSLAATAQADHLSTAARPRSSELAELGDRIRSIRVHQCAKFRITLDGQNVKLPVRLRRALALPLGQEILALVPAAGADWPALGALVEPISDLVGRRELGPRLHVAVLRLQTAQVPIASPMDEDLAEALGITLQQLRETRQRVEGAIERVLWLIRPIVAHSHGTHAAETALGAQPVDREELAAALAPLADGLPESPQELVETARNAHSLDELRRACGFPFADFNRTLTGLAGYEPISHASEHADALERFLSLRRGTLLQSLRRARVSRFDARDPQPDWPALRRLDYVALPDEWKLEVDEADAPLLERHVRAALEAKLGTPLPAKGERLQSLDTVQASNRSLITRAVPGLIVLVRASGQALPVTLAQQDSAEAVQRTLDRAGALDFRPLDPDALVGWLAALHEWPKGMLTSADPDVHGLSPEDLAKAQDAVSASKAEKARRRRVLEVAGKEVDVAESLAEFLPLIQQTLDQQPGFFREARNFSLLDELEPRQPRLDRRSGGGKGHRGGDRVLSNEQTSAVGCAGEYLAWQWLLQRYPEANDSSWVSTNRRHTLTGDPGDDGLGYDLEVRIGRNPLMFEVKAFRGPGGEIELGETEVDSARRHAATDRWRLLVINEVFNPAARRMQMLPNPFGKRGRGRYRELGGSLRYAYRLP